MHKTWKPQTAGILTIIGGLVGLLASFGILIAITALGTIGNWTNEWVVNGDVFTAISILCVIGIPMFFCGVVALIGGIFALQKKYWGVALAGAIAAFFPVWVIGLLAVIFTATSRDEFNPAARPISVVEKVT